MATQQLNAPISALGPVSRTSLAGRISVILLRFILAENLQTGSQLPPERELAASLGVSHRVVREALGILVGRGIIVKEHGRGAFVTEFDRERVQVELVVAPSREGDGDDVRSARCAIEIGMMLLVAQNATAADIEALQGLIDQMQAKVARGASPVGEDILFHQTLLKATHSPTMRQLGHLITESLQRAVYDSPGWLRRSLKDMSHVIPAHQAIVDAVRRRDGQAATLAMMAHLQWRLDERPWHSKKEEAHDRGTDTHQG
jgi:GntR family transcriptional regulator, transcriptional repressor for pyruvate dehydrogenase complex